MLMASIETYEKYKDSAMAFHKQNQDTIIEWFRGQKLNIDLVPEEKEKTWLEKLLTGFRWVE